MRYSKGFMVVRRLLGELQVFDRVGICKKNVRRNDRYLIELRAVRSLLEDSEVFDELRTVSSLLAEWRGIR